jgi:hypothetical protein
MRGQRTADREERTKNGRRNSRADVAAERKRHEVAEGQRDRGAEGQRGV